MFLSETHGTGTWDEVYVTPSGTFRVIASGLAHTHRQGVAFIIEERLIGMVSDVRYSALEPGRVLSLDLTAATQTYTFVGVYAPAFDVRNRSYSEDLRVFGTFLEELENFVAVTGRRKVVLGDLNASLGQVGEGTELVIGQFGFGTINDRGFALLLWCIRAGLFAANTLFDSPLSERWSWESPDSGTHKLLDYILVSEDSRDCVKQSGVLRDAVIKSDHRAIFADFDMQHVRRERFVPVFKPRDDSALKCPEVVAKYRQRCAEFCLQVSQQDLNLNDKVAALETSVKQAAAETLPVLDRRVTARFFTESCKALCAERSNLLNVVSRTDTQRKRLNFLGRQIRRRIKMDRETYVREKCEECLAASKQHNGMKALFGAAADLAGDSRGGAGPTPISSEQWTTHFNDLFTTLALDIDDSIFERLESVADVKVAEELRQLISAETPTKAEIRFELDHSGKNRAPGIDGICVELYQEGGEECLTLIHDICAMIFEEELWPDAWAEAVLVAIYKRKGLKTNPDNYRGIALVSHASKLLCAVLRRRLSVVVDRLIGEYQCGFRSGRGTTDADLTYHILSERLRDMGVPLYTSFVDFRKAFDSVNWKILFHILRIAGVPDKLVGLIENLYAQSSFRVRMDGGQLSEATKPVVGVRQGCILSPLLFIIFLEFLLRLVYSLPHAAAVRVGKCVIELLGYADDLALMSTLFMGLQERLYQLDKTFLDVGMAVSLDKTEQLFQGAEGEQRQCRIRDKELRTVDKFAYLGVVQSKDATSHAAIRHRLAKASSAFHVLRKLWKRPLDRKLKGLVYRAIVRAIALYGAGTWTTLDSDNRLLETFEMNCIRSILGINRIEHVNSVDLRAMLGIHTSIVDEVCKDRLRLYGHAARMDATTRWLRSFVNLGTSIPHARKGRPQKCWMACVDSDLKARGYGLCSGAHLARKSRDAYRSKIVNGKVVQ